MFVYWKADADGMTGELGCLLALILLVCGIFGKLMTRGLIAQGFIWLGYRLGITGSAICIFTFIVTAIIATSTGTSVGTMLTIFPILLPVGAFLGADSSILIGAILSGALFGNTIGPISDVTIAASQTQEYRNGARPDIGDTVKARFKYALIAGILTIILYAFFGSGHNTLTAESKALMENYSNPKGLLMLIPVIILLIIAFKTKNIFIAASGGITSGTIVGLLAGILSPSDIVTCTNGELGGFVIDGIRSMMGQIMAIFMIVAIIGIISAGGMMESLVKTITNSKIAGTPLGADLIISLGTAFTSLIIGCMNAPACLMYGPIANEVGKNVGLHPFRRANLIACFSTTLPAMFPFTSVFIIITMGNITSILEEYPFINSVTPLSIPGGMFFCITFPLVFFISMFTGWGREYEGPDGEVIKTRMEK